MILKRLQTTVGTVVGTNCYIVKDEKTKETMVIDPGSDINTIVNVINAIDCKVKYILLTHCHGDHISGANEIRNILGGKILIHRDDEQGLKNPEVNLADYIGLGEIAVNADSRLNDSDLLHIGDLEFKVLHTPGHTKGGVCLYCEEEKLLFSGDTLFRGSWGRIDLPTGSFQDIIDSITNKIMTLPEDTIVYPGHGKSTMIKEEEPIYMELKGKTY